MQISSRVWRYTYGKNHRRDFALKFVGLVRMLDHHFRNDTNKRLDDEIYDGVFYA